MKQALCILVLLTLFVSGVKANIYLIIYATKNGQTGHCGIAVDNYTIFVRDVISNGETSYIYDTTHTGTLTYFDLWPEKDEYKGAYDEDTKPRYYQLPSTSFKQLISLKTLQDQGLPHKLNYPCDGIIALPTSKKTDMSLVRFLQQVRAEQKPFNAMKYNCCDFTVQALSFIGPEEIGGREYIIKGLVRTPNELYKEISSWPGAVIIKDPGKAINGTFVHERILTRFIPLLRIF